MIIKNKKQKLREECYDVSYEFVKWLNVHLKQYLKDASKFVDLEWKKYEYEEKEYTQKEIIQKLIDITDYLTQNLHFNNDAEEKVNAMFELFYIVYWDMWW